MNRRQRKFMEFINENKNERKNEVLTTSYSTILLAPLFSMLSRISITRLSKVNYVKSFLTGPISAH